MLVHATEVPGTQDLARLTAEVTYRYGETPAGGRIEIATRHPDALAALHRFLAFDTLRPRELGQLLATWDRTLATTPAGQPAHLLQSLLGNGGLAKPTRSGRGLTNRR
jgi:hypothetical protein